MRSAMGEETNQEGEESGGDGGGKQNLSGDLICTFCVK